MQAASESSTDPIPCISGSLERYPSINPFALAVVRNDPRASAFVNRNALGAAGERVRSAVLVSAQQEQNAAWGNDVSAELGRWQRGETLTLVAGQQVGIGGGPLYTAAKLASLLSMRDRLRREGKDATVFFWMATEDNDFDEVAHVAIQEKDGSLITAAERAVMRRPIGDLPVPSTLLSFLAGKLGVSDASWLRDGVTFRDSFALLVSEALRGRGVVLVDSLLPQLRTEGKELFERILQRLPQYGAEIDYASADLRAAGFRPQVEARDGHYSVLYVLDDAGERQPIRYDGEWRIGNQPVSAGHVSALVAERPERVSTGVLARPLLQDFVFEPDIFVGGPAEVAYYAQLRNVYPALGVRQPYVALRGHALVAISRVLKTFDRYGLEAEELFLSPEAIITRHDPSLAASFLADVAGTRDRLEEELGRLASRITAADATLDRSSARAIRRIRFHFDRLGERGARAVARFDTDRFQSVARLTRTLAPGGQPQDRVAGWLGYWLQFGDAFFDRLIASVEPDSDRFVVVGL